MGSAPVIALPHLRTCPAQTDSAASVLSSTMGPAALDACVSDSLNALYIRIHTGQTFKLTVLLLS